MRSEAEYIGKSRRHLRVVQPFNLDALVAGFVAGSDRNVAAREVERLAQQLDQRLVGRALDRRGCETDEQGVAAPAGDRGTAGAGDDPDMKRRLRSGCQGANVPGCQSTRRRGGFDDARH
jgi:hypothetical protein